jgi:aryl-alcohol dehydrogenase-like predicted oxidoreductase
MMRRHTLGQTGLTVSHLGFGCARLTSHRDRPEAIRILEQAFAQGVTHFDVSRIYGFGRSEGILGEFLRGKRDKVTVATKFGIQPPPGLSGNQRAIALVKKILGPFPGLLQRAKRRSSNMVQTGVFNPQSAVQSLEISLRELGTDSVDLFFLHEATLAEALSEPLIETLQQQVKRGTIRCFGVASAFEKFQGKIGQLPAAYQVAQFEDNAVARNLSTLTVREGFATITHSIFNPFGRLREAAAAQPALTQKYASRMGLDLADSKVVGSLLLHYALRSNAGGAVLFSSLDPNRVAANVRDAESSPYSDQQLSDFVEFGEEILRPSPASV